MELQGRNLKIQMRGEDVKLLHAELRKLGYGIVAAEHMRVRFDEVTQKAVRDFQKKRDLPITGVVDKRTAKAINDAVDALREQPAAFSVKGHTLQRNRRPASNVIVKAFDKDLRRETELGEALTDAQGAYKITYTAERFHRLNKTAANLIVRAYTEDGVQLGQSKIIFRAKKSEAVDLVVKLPPKIKTSEFETALKALESFLDDLPLAALTDDDIRFLLKESGGDISMDVRRLTILADSARLARDTGLPTEFFYGLARQLNLEPHLVLKTLLALPMSKVAEGFTESIRHYIIPARFAETVEATLGRFERVKLERGALEERQVTGRLLNEESGKPLAGYRVHATHRHRNDRPRDLGSDLTDKRGRFSFVIITLPAAVAEEEDRPLDRLHLRILTPENEEIHQAKLEIQAGQSELPDIQVPVSVLPSPPVHPIRDVARSVRLELPEALTAFLAERKIGSIEDIRRAGGLRRLDKLPVAVDHPAVKALEAQSNLSVLTTNIEENARLIDKGFDSLGAIAATPRESFVGAVGEELGEPKAVQVHAVARAQQQLLNSVLAGIGADVANGLVPKALQREGTEIFEVEEDYLQREVIEQFPSGCACPDCEAAVSPTAYLADLLDYAVEHVKRGLGVGEFITLEELANHLHQPFGDLPASCEAVSEQVRQVRLCVEVLRHYLEEPLADADEAVYCFAAYTMLLGKLGTSFEELRLSRTADADTRQALAQRLGIDLSAERPDPLDAMLLDSDTMTEADLERLFGLVDSTRDPLSTGLIEGDRRDQIAHWRLNGIEWSWNTDPTGLVYVRLLRPSSEIYLVELYRDRERNDLVASGTTDSPQGTLTLSPANGSGLSGQVQLDYKRDTTSMALVAVPIFLCWRLRHLRTLWKTQDGIADPYTQTPVSPYTETDLLPLIDPDVIGPDDFRTPFETAPGGLFGLWIERRRWVDGQLDELRTLLKTLRRGEETRSDADALIAVLEHNYPLVELRPPWPDSGKLVTGVSGVFEALGENLVQGRDLEETERHIRDGMRLTVDSFTRLREIQAKAEEKAEEQEWLPAEDWEEVFSILVQAQKRREFSTWRDKERDAEQRMGHVLFGPRHFWLSLREPVEGTWPPRQPYPLIDPEVVKLADLPEPTAGQRAITLWLQRRAELDQAYNELKAAHEPAGAAGFNDLFAVALGDPPTEEDWETYLIQLLNRVRRAEASRLEEVLEVVESELKTLHLTQDDLARVLEIQGKENSTEEEWSEVYAILTSCRKHREAWSTRWRKEEQADPVLGDKYWLACKANLPKWRASVADRQAWRQALLNRSRSPVIDPDLIDQDYLRKMTSGVAYGVWRERQRWISDRVADLRQRREAAATPLAGFDAILIDSLFEPGAAAGLEAQYRAIRETSGDVDDLIRQALGVSQPDLVDLRSDLDDSDTAVAGESLRNVTERLGFSVEEFRRLVGLLSGTVTESGWNEVYTILARATLVASVVTLAQEQEQGKAVTERLAQLGLTNAAFSYLVRMRKLLASGAELQDTEWADVYSIFVQVQKCRIFATWRTEEQDASLSLGPDYFQIPEPLPLQFPPPEPEPLPAWRATQRDLREWRNTLKSRIEQVDTTTAALRESVGATEEATLPALRDALVMAADTEDSNLATKAKRLTDLLLIDMQSSGCQQTTRISQAIETVQGFLWGLRTGQLQDTYEGLTLLADDFDEEWSWIGSYATWRAAMFVFLYPENILLPSLRTTWQTPGFQILVNELSNNRRLTIEQAREVLARYEDYLEDVSGLRLLASVRPEGRSIVYVFGVGAMRGGSYTTYVSRYNTEDNTPYPQSPWEPIPGLECATEIVGATVYRDFIYLFACIQEAGDKMLVYTKYDLNQDAEWTSIQDLELPEAAENHSFSVVIEQNDSTLVSPHLAIHIPTVRAIYERSFNWEGTGWKEDEWKILALVNGIDSLSAMIGLSGGFCLIAKIDSGRLSYRFFGAKDDGRWTIIEGIYRWKGGFRWPRTDLIYIFGSADSGLLKSDYYKLIRSRDPLGSETKANFEEFDTWLSLMTMWLYPFSSLAYALESHVFKITEENECDLFSAIINPESLADVTGLSIAVVKARIRPEINSFTTNLLDESQEWKFVNSILKEFTIEGLSLEHVLRKILDNTPIDVKFRTGDSIDKLGEFSFDALVYASGSIGHSACRFFGSRDSNYRTVFAREANDHLTMSTPVQITPKIGTTINITESLSASELQTRRNQIEDLFVEQNAGAPSSVLGYLEEAYYFVPIHLALQFQRHGRYKYALDWFRTVYDYRAPTNRRKISYVLRRDEDLSLDYERVADWLLDPLNPHRIATNRRNTYTRFTLLALVRCFLEYADAEFSRDTAESVPRARALYTTALELLDESSLKQRISSTCEELIAEFSIEVGRQVETSAPEYKSLWYGILFGLHQIISAETLFETIGTVRRALSTDQPWETRLTRALDLIDEVSPPAPRPIKAVVAARKEKAHRTYEVLLSQSWIASAAGAIGGSVEKRLRNVTDMLGAFPAVSTESEATDLIDRYAKPLNAAGFYAYQPSVSFDFCIPPNPVSDALRLRAELNLYKIRTCRNIAGMERQLDPYAAPTDTVSGLPQIGAEGNLVLPGTVTLQPTPYRYQVLIERTKQLAQMAAQFEAAMLAALEKRDAEDYQVLKANQDVQLTRQGVRLQELRVREAEDGVELAELQRDRAQMLVEEYLALIDANLTENEQVMIDAYISAKGSRIAATAAGAAGRAAQTWATSKTLGYSMAAIASIAYIAEAVWTGYAIASETEAQVAAVWANYERRKQEWELEKKTADQDVKIGQQQITLANDRVRVVGQERKIAEMQADHAKEVVDFLANKFGNVELYDWMSGMLEGVYSFFLQQATAMAKLAENQVAFECQEIPPVYIQADYWEAPAGMTLGTSAEGAGPDRRGLTGSARLLEDIYQLDLYAFKTDQRKLQLTKTLSLARMAPGEFERFRQTGVMRFDTPMNLFDHDFPGHYLRLIKRVSTSVIALIPPTEGIHATLSTTGLSRVVIGSGGLFQKIDVRRYPESIALTSPINATGLFELTPQNQEMLLPFEGMGVDTFWEFRMPKAANRFDYRTIADVLITIEYTALEDFTYRQQVIRELDNSVSGDRPFSFRHDMPDQWYDLHHPDQTGTPMVIRFETRRADFPPNIEDLRIQQLLLYFARVDGAAFEVPVTYLQFTEQGEAGPVRGGATSSDGLISTRSGNAGSWIVMTGKAPIGVWELALPNTAGMQNRFKNGEIENILFVVTYSGRTPAWPD